MEREEIENLINSVPTTPSNRSQLPGTSGQITGQNQTATVNHSPSLDQNGTQMPTSESKFDKLLNIMNEMQSTMNILKWDIDDIKSVKQDIQDLKQVVSTQEETIKHIQMAKQNLKSEVDMLCKLVAHQDHIIQNLQGKLVDQQKQSMQKNLILSGLVEPEKETDLQLEMAVDDFFQNCVQLEYNITYERFTD